MEFNSVESQMMLIGLTIAVMLASFVEAEKYRECMLEAEKEYTMYRISAQQQIMSLQQQLREAKGHEIH